MKTTFQFNAPGIGLLLTNAICFGGCLVLLLLGRASGPLIILTIATLGMLAGKIGTAYCRVKAPEPPNTPQ